MNIRDKCRIQLQIGGIHDKSDVDTNIMGNDVTKIKFEEINNAD